MDCTRRLAAAGRGKQYPRVCDMLWEKPVSNSRLQLMMLMGIKLKIPCALHTFYNL